jgi:hypothetical protein
MGILDQAHNAVHVDRRKDYLHPAVFFQQYASLLSTLLAGKLKEPITPEEANLSMILFKVVREHGKHKADNLVDIAGYAETLAMIHDYKESQELSTTPSGQEKGTE